MTADFEARLAAVEVLCSQPRRELNPDSNLGYYWRGYDDALAEVRAAMAVQPAPVAEPCEHDWRPGGEGDATCRRCGAYDFNDETPVHIETVTQSTVDLLKYVATLPATSEPGQPAETADFYEDDEPIEDIQKILARPADGVTGCDCATWTVGGGVATCGRCGRVHTARSAVPTPVASKVQWRIEERDGFGRWQRIRGFDRDKTNARAGYEGLCVNYPDIEFRLVRDTTVSEVVDTAPPADTSPVCMVPTCGCDGRDHP